MYPTGLAKMLTENKMAQFCGVKYRFIYSKCFRRSKTSFEIRYFDTVTGCDLNAILSWHYKFNAQESISQQNISNYLFFGNFMNV